MRRLAIARVAFSGRSRGTVGIEYAFLAAAAVIGLALGAAALTESGATPVEQVIWRASAVAQAGDGPGFSVWGNDGGR